MADKETNDHVKAPADKGVSEEYTDVSIVVKKHKKMIQMYNDREDVEEIKKAFDAAFDKSVVTHHEDGRVEKYDEMLERNKAFAEAGYKIKLCGFKRLTPKSYKYIVSGSNAEKCMTVRSVCYVENEKVVRVEVGKFEYLDKVSGQVTASDGASIPGFPTEEDLSKGVLRSPEEVMGKRMLSSVEPANSIQEVIKLRLQRRRFFLQEDIVLIKTVDGGPYAGGLQLRKHWTPSLELPWLMLHDKEGEPVALILVDVIATAITICSRQPLFEDDDAVSTKDGVDFYQWFRAKLKPFGSKLEYHPVYIWDGKDFSPFLRRTMSEQSKCIGVSSACDILDSYQVDTNPENDLHYSITQYKNNYREATLTVAPGVDPALPLCLSAAGLFVTL